MNLKKIYYSLEDRYYRFVEKTGIYKVTDKIDKVMPSFLLCILLFLILIFGIFYLILGSSTQGDITFYMQVKDAESDYGIEGVPITVSYDNISKPYPTGSDGLTDKLNIPKNTEFSVEVDYTGSDYKMYNEIFNSSFISEDETLKIMLRPQDKELTKTYNFSVYNKENKQKVNNKGYVSFKCENNSLESPSSVDLENGEVEVVAKNDCDLIATVNVGGFLEKTDIPINDSVKSVHIEPKEGSFASSNADLTVNVKDNSSNYISNIKVSVYDKYNTLEGECVTSQNTGCTISDLITSKEYNVKLTDNRLTPIYNSKNLNTFTLDDDKVMTEYLSTDVSGYLRIEVRDKETNQIVNNIDSIKLKNVDNTLNYSSSDQNNYIFTVPNLNGNYRIVVDAPGYMLSSTPVTPTDQLSDNPFVIELEELDPNQLGNLNIRVLDEDAKGFKFAKVILYDAESDFLTDYSPKITNYDGNVTFNIRSGTYYARAIKGGSEGVSNTFEFDVRSSSEREDVVIPMQREKGDLTVSVVDKDNNPIENARIDIYDRFSYRNYSNPKLIKSDLTGANAQKSFTLDSQNSYYAVVSDPINNRYGSTQSRFIEVLPSQNQDLEVVLYDDVSSLSKPELNLIGLYKDDLKLEDQDNEVKGSLSEGESYKARFNLKVPNNRSGIEEFEEIGVIIRTGSSPYIENDSIFIKEFDVPNPKSIKKYTQYTENSPHMLEGIYDDDTKVDGEAKWVHLTLDNPYYITKDNGSYEDYCNTYEIETTLKIKDSATFGEELKLYYLGYGLREDGDYETYNPYTGTEPIEYSNVFSEQTYGIGDEVFCDEDFCFSANIVNLETNIREGIDNEYGAKPGNDYKLNFMLINNKDQQKYNDSRFVVENQDKSIDFKDIEITGPNGDIINGNTINEYEFDYQVSLLDAKKKIQGDVYFNTLNIGNSYLNLKFISDQKVLFSKNILLNINSNKEFDVEVRPEIIPTGTSFDILVDARDKETNVPVTDSKVIVKDQFYDILDSKDIGTTGKVSVTNIPAQNLDDKVYVYVTAPGYKTYVKEIKASDTLFSINPRKLAYSIDIFEDNYVEKEFTIKNLSEMDLEIENMEVAGDNLEYIDLSKINAALEGYVGQKIAAINPDNTLNQDSKLDIDLEVSTNPAVQEILEVTSFTALLKVELKPEGSTGPVWLREIPVEISLGFDGLVDDKACLTLSEYEWNEVVLGKNTTKSIMFNNDCSINSREIPLTNGLEAKLEFESAPLGTFTLNAGGRVLELTQGHFKTIYDSLDKDSSLPLTITYEPKNRMDAEIKGKIILRSSNLSQDGSQNMTSEINFNLDVLNLSDCYSISKEVIDIYRDTESFYIENKDCKLPTEYSLVCDDCRGIDIEPQRNIVVDGTGKSQEINITAFDAVPGAYNLTIFSSIKDQRGSSRNVGNITLNVRPVDQCLDLDRYEFDLYRSDHSKSTGMKVNAKSYDTANIINTCYKQEIDIKGTVDNTDKFAMSLMSFVKDGLLTSYVSNGLNSIGHKSFGNILTGGIAKTDKDRAYSITQKVQKKTQELEDRKELLEKAKSDLEKQDDLTDQEQENLEEIYEDIQEINKTLSNNKYILDNIDKITYDDDSKEKLENIEDAVDRGDYDGARAYVDGVYNQDSVKKKNKTKADQEAEQKESENPEEESNKEQDEDEEPKESENPEQEQSK